ncbi:MAG: HXXEE domain-containing protein [Thermodesulfobacteriota bacterium]
MSYRQVIWLAPLAYAVHILEEAPNFPAWTSRHFTGGFTTAQFVKNNLIVMAILIALTILASAHSRRWTILLHFFQLYGGIFHNALFHIAAAAWLGVLSPGLISAILLYVPLTYRVTILGWREGRLPQGPAMAVFVLAGLAQSLFVYSQLFTTAFRL